MSSDLILKETRALPLADRIQLCRSLWGEILESKELTPGEAELIESRMQDHLANPEAVVSLEEVRARLDAKYGR
jgi:putative addiction module component (TIGR02574 family)